MKTLHYTIDINASVETVWNTMLEDKTYRMWTEDFHEGSYYEGNWKEGSEIRFLALHEGKLGGMYSRIKENKLHEFISIEHLGMINDGEIDTTSEEVKKWAPAFENYTFQGKNGHTRLTVDMQTNEDYQKMFDDMWPRALQKLKALCENT